MFLQNIYRMLIYSADNNIYIKPMPFFSMRLSETLHILAAIIVLTAAAGFSYALKSDWSGVIVIFFFSLIIICLAVAAQKTMAHLLDAEAEHRIWTMLRFGFKANYKLKTEFPMGVVLPLFLSVFSLGWIKFPALLVYETKAKKYRAAKRFGFYSFAEMTEWHNALVGASGIFVVLALSFVAYFLGSGFEVLSRLAAFYAFANMLPISNLNGTQIFFGSKILYVTLAIITLIFFAYAFIFSALGI